MLSGEGLDGKAAMEAKDVSKCWKITFFVVSKIFFFRKTMIYNLCMILTNTIDDTKYNKLTIPYNNIIKSA